MKKNLGKKYHHSLSLALGALLGLLGFSSCQSQRQAQQAQKGKVPAEEYLNDREVRVMYGVPPVIRVEKVPHEEINDQKGKDGQ